ncbi:MAG TPA: hypothetical protein VLG92_04715 [Candidatus Saccharimonadia bacterium]|nr:hypothetical protein [Candidatus Saccharimonadia bacterium]
MNIYKFPQAPLASSLEEAAEYAEALHENEYPAFQVDAESLVARRQASSPLLAELAVLGVLEEVNYHKSGAPIPFTEGSPWLRTKLNGELTTFSPHTDGVDFFRALALHRELEGSATALFGHMADPTDIDFFASDPRERKHGFEEIADRLQKIYQAPINPDRFTIFSEGNLPGLLPAVHYFGRTSAEPAAYSRTTSRVSDGTLSPVELEDAAAQCKLRIVRDRYLWQITAHLFPFTYPDDDSIQAVNFAKVAAAERVEDLRHSEHLGRYLRYIGEEVLSLADGDKVVVL